MISICCVGFAFIDVVCDELNDCAWNLSVESFAHIECYSDCSRKGAIWLNQFATVLFNVCSAVTVECCVLYQCCVGAYGMFAVM